MNSKNDNKISVSSSLPYPNIAIEKPNEKYAQLLSLDFASPNSEMTAIFGYAYQNWIFNSEFSHIANTIARISMVEMHHLDILGQLILLLGGNPKYQVLYQNNYFVWNGNAVNYSKNIKQCITNNIKAEQNAFDNYVSQAKLIKDTNVSAMLTRISLDEQIHINIFNNYLSQI